MCGIYVGEFTWTMRMATIVELLMIVNILTIIIVVIVVDTTVDVVAIVFLFDYGRRGWRLSRH